MRQRFGLRKALVAAVVGVAAVVLAGCSPASFDYWVENTTDEAVWVTFSGDELYSYWVPSYPSEAGWTVLQPGERVIDTVDPAEPTHKVEADYGLLAARDAVGQTVFSAPLVLLVARDEGCVVRLGDPLVDGRADCRHDEPYSEEVRLQLARADRALRWIDAQPLVLLGVAAVYVPIALLLLRWKGGFSRVRERQPRRGTESTAIAFGLGGAGLGLLVLSMIELPGGGAVEGPLLVTSLGGVVAAFGATERRRQKISSWLLLLGGAQVILTGMWSATTGFWLNDTTAGFVSTLFWGWVMFGGPGVLAIVAGVVLRRGDDDTGPVPGLAG